MLYVNHRTTLTFLTTTAILWTLGQCVRFEFLNRAQGEIWVGIQGNPGHEPLRNGGFILRKGEKGSADSPEKWAGRFWPRTWCDPNTKHCLTGDCGNKLECNGAGGNPPASLAEITLKGDFGLDFYDVSLVDGFNLEIAIEPVGGQGDGGQYSCKKSACQVPINKDCPAKLQVRHDGQVIACNSACNALDTDQYCCRNAHDKPETCRSTDWPVDYPKFFKDRCPDAYSYAYDDHKSTFTCKSSKYLITFG